MPKDKDSPEHGPYVLPELFGVNSIVSIPAPSVASSRSMLRVHLSDEQEQRLINVLHPSCSSQVSSPVHVHNSIIAAHSLSLSRSQVTSSPFITHTLMISISINDGLCISDR